MKTRFALLAAILLLGTAEKAQFVVENTNGSTTTTTNNNLTFSRYGTSWRIGTVPIDNVKSITLQPLAERLQGYSGPTYADDYRNITSWSNRTKWNLANVHDPTVLKAADGY